MAFLALLAVRRGDRIFQTSLILAIVVLTALVGTNHIATIWSGQTSVLHEIFAVVNYALVVLGAWVLAFH